MLGLDLIGHVGEAIILWGTFMIARGRNGGFAWRMVGNIGWIWIGWQIGMTSIWFWCSAFMIVDAIGWYRHAHPPRGLR